MKAIMFITLKLRLETNIGYWSKPLKIKIDIKTENKIQIGEKY